MKKAVLIIIKVLLFVFFLHNIGVFSYMANFEPSEAPPLKEDGGRADIEYLNEKIKRANDLGDNYGPEEYFSDLTDIRLKELNNEFDRSVIIAVNNSKSTLGNYFNLNLKRKRTILSSCEYDSYVDRIEIARDIHYEVIDPGHREREAERISRIKEPGYWKGLFLKIFESLKNFYLKNLGIAFILLWVWWYQEKEKVKIDNPLSFFLCLVFYPIVIARTWIMIIRENSRFFAMTIELRSRSVSLFSLFSEDEIKELRLLAKGSIKISEYRSNLDQAGLVRQHSLILAMTVTIMFIFVPRSIEASSFSESKKLDREVCVSINSPPCSNQANFSEKYLDSDHDVFLSFGVILENIFIFLFK
jgi:hypothetical protein